MKLPLTRENRITLVTIGYRLTVIALLLWILNIPNDSVQSNKELHKAIKIKENDLLRFQENLRTDIDNIRSMDNSRVDSSWTRYWKNRQP